MSSRSDLFVINCLRVMPSYFYLGAQLKGRLIRTNWAARKATPQSKLMCPCLVVVLLCSIKCLFCSFESAKPQTMEEIARQTSPYNSTVYVGNLPPNCTGNICFIHKKITKGNIKGFSLKQSAYFAHWIIYSN